MKRFPIVMTLALAAALPLGSATSPAQKGTVEFRVVVTPASGHPEPAMRQMIYLLRSSFTDAQQLAEKAEPKPSLDKFIDGLEGSAELKAWMRKKHTVTIVGGPFHAMLTPEDLVGVPEFLAAYVEGNLTESRADVGFPSPKYRPQDKIKNPEKYELKRKQYLEAIRKYYAKNRDSADTIDVVLRDSDRTAEWDRLISGWRKRVSERALQEAQQRDLAAKIETNLQGQGAFEVPPGNYWLSTLDGQVIVGDVRLRWNLPLVVEAGLTTRVELSNVNAERNAP